MDEFEKRWKRIQEALAQDMNGDVKPRVTSGRTLFGIRSEGETKMDEFARKIEAEFIQRHKEEQRRESEQAE